MNFSDAIAAMRSYFAGVWGNTTLVAYDDAPFKTPNGQTWVRFSIKHADGFQASTGAPGANRFRREGLITAQVFQPQGKGSKDARQKADLIADAFIGKQISDITFDDVTIREIGNDGAGWYQINVLIEFRYDRIT